MMRHFSQKMTLSSIFQELSQGHTQDKAQELDQLLNQGLLFKENLRKVQKN